MIKQTKNKKNYISKSFNIEKSQKVVIFITSIIISLGFKGIKIWLIRILASLCRKPWLISSFYKILLSIGTISHTKCQEYNLEKRMNAVDPTSWLLKGSNI